MEEIKFPSPEDINKMFKRACGKLRIDFSTAKKEIAHLVIYEMTDGSRTSTDLKGWRAYYDGGLFCLRFIHFAKILGIKNLYINVIHGRHRFRVNYPDIYKALLELVPVYRDYAIRNRDIRWIFVGDYKKPIGPEDKKGKDLVSFLKELERKTAKREGMTVIFMLNYSTKWLETEGKEKWKELPEANVILRHSKGYVNGDMWLPGKLDNNSFMYVQNGSSSRNFSDLQIIYLIAIALRSYILNKGTHYSKNYEKEEKEEIRFLREKALSIVIEELEITPRKKRAIIFSSFGPEIYEF